MWCPDRAPVLVELVAFGQRFHISADAHARRKCLGVDALVMLGRHVQDHAHPSGSGRGCSRPTPPGLRGACWSSHGRDHGTQPHRNGGRLSACRCETLALRPQGPSCTCDSPGLPSLTDNRRARVRQQGADGGVRNEGAGPPPLTAIHASSHRPRETAAPAILQHLRYCDTAILRYVLG